MGLDIHGARFLMYSRTLGVDFSRTAMIGRQDILLSKRELKNSFQAFGQGVDDQLIDRIFTQDQGYAEPLLAHLGARDVHSFDFSAHEGATHLCDMNKEIPDAAKEQYSTVLDGGSLEHVFNFPIAIKNCMEMVKVGGHYLGITTANNFLGHGFYQFSPELFYSIFTPENGFELTSLIACELRPGATWYSVKNPHVVKRRVTLVNGLPLYLLIVAKKLTNAVIFDTSPQQSDYVSAWTRHEDDPSGEQQTAPRPIKQSATLDRIRRAIPFPLRRMLRKAMFPEFDNRFFQPFDPAASMVSKVPVTGMMSTKPQEESWATKSISISNTP